MDKADFSTRFETLTGHSPFPWQRVLYERFVEDDIPPAASLPTGVGKTNVIAVWLLALLARPDLMPRRLVYVVNRRTVVDQTTAEVKRLRERVPELAHCDFKKLAISTLRGQFADNAEWSADPSRPAVICGTVDMIGSRLLFSGYRIGFRSRPLHAGFLGQDALLVHDEAHLEPAFQELVETIRAEQDKERQRCGDVPWPGLRVMALSATARGERAKGQNPQPFGLTEEESHPPDAIPDPPTEPIHHVWRRLKAKKSLGLHPCGEKEKELAGQLVERALAHGASGDAVLVFARRVADALDVLGQLEKRHPHKVAPLTGTMRGHERDHLVRNNPVFARFMPESDRSGEVSPAEGTVYLVCTSAGEVGVNLSADHMVCDLSTFDSMAQRLGRVNRFGDSPDHIARVDVVHPTSFDDKKPNPQRKVTLDLLSQLNDDASPKSLSGLMDSLSDEERGGAFAPPPTIPQATDILFDAWAMTTIRGEMPGRPQVEPYLHGIAEWEPPRTSIAWRDEVEWVGRDLIERHGEDLPQSLLDAYPLKPHELLNDTTERVHKALTERAKHLENDVPVWLVSDGGDARPDSIKSLLAAEKKQTIERLASRTILLPPSFGGLANGMLDGKSEQAHDVADEWQEEGQQRRARLWDDEPPPVGMALVRTIDTRPYEESEGADASSDPTSRPRFWHWYVRPADTEEATPASLRPVNWRNHTDDVIERTKRIMRALGLPDDLQQAVTLAAELHDLGKRRELWQRSIGNPNPTDWHAKPGKPVDGPRWRPRHITDYRHEFGSLLDALDGEQPHLARLEAMADEMRDLVLHLVAAHHGYARPHFPPDRAIDPDHPQSEADAVALETMRRYARLQRQYGRWGLAYLESLLRAADWAASAEPTRTDAPETKQEATA